MTTCRDGTHVQVRGQHVGAGSLLPDPCQSKTCQAQRQSALPQSLLLVRKLITVTEFCSLCPKVDLITFA